MTPIRLKDFPNSYNDPFLQTSDPTPCYNCIAWAFEDNNTWYWPDPENTYYWPEGISREIKLSSFIDLFRLKKYKCCKNGEFQKGFIKIAIFVDENNLPTHAARQLENGYWTSKLGKYIDIQHSITAMEGGYYGNVAVFMKKRTRPNLCTRFLRNSFLKRYVDTKIA